SPQILLTGILIGHQTFGCRYDRNSQAVDDPWYITRFFVYPQSRSGNSFHRPDQRGVIRFQIFQSYADSPLGAIVIIEYIPVDKTIIVQDFGQALFQVGCRNRDYFVSRHLSVSDTSQIICYWICNYHFDSFIILPTGFCHTWNLSGESHFSESDPVYTKFSHIAFWSTGQLASVVQTNGRRIPRQFIQRIPVSFGFQFSSQVGVLCDHTLSFLFSGYE